MTDLRLLQEGRLRRSELLRYRRRRRRRAFFAVVLLAALAAVWWKVIPHHHKHVSTRSAQSITTPAGTTATHAPTAPTDHPAGYAQTLAPPAERLLVEKNLQGTVALTQPLTAGMLFDVNTGQVLWERRPDAELPIASLTKMMTALVSVQHSKPTANVLITKQAENFTGSGVGLLPLGKQIIERDLLYGLLLPSGNDAAIALAQHVGHTQQNFISMMNTRAQEMGLTCTHYTTETGVKDAGNHSCAMDLAILGHAMLGNPTLSKIVGTQQEALKFPIKSGKLYLTNNNPLYLMNYPGTDGVKTGYTTAAGMCLVATVKRGNTWLGVVLLHSANWGTQAEALLNAGFSAVKDS